MANRMIASRRRPRVAAILLLSVAAAGCAHAPRPSLLPLTLVGDGGSWGGLITAEGILVTSAQGEVLVRKPDVFVVLRRNLLLNSELSDTRFISVLVDPADCMVDGRHYGYKAYVGVSVNRGEGDYQMRGCATPAGDATLPAAGREFR